MTLRTFRLVISRKIRATKHGLAGRNLEEIRLHELTWQGRSNYNPCPHPGQVREHKLRKKHTGGYIHIVWHLWTIQNLDVAMMFEQRSAPFSYFVQPV